MKATETGNEVSQLTLEFTSLYKANNLIQGSLLTKLSLQGFPLAVTALVTGKFVSVSKCHSILWYSLGDPILDLKTRDDSGYG